MFFSTLTSNEKSVLDCCPTLKKYCGGAFVSQTSFQAFARKEEEKNAPQQKISKRGK